jgi:hypothetical protein
MWLYISCQKSYCALSSSYILYITSIGMVQHFPVITLSYAPRFCSCLSKSLGSVYFIERLFIKSSSYTLYSLEEALNI